MSNLKREVCQACGITAGPKQMETRTFQVGNYQICGWCLGQLKKHGALQVQPYQERIYLCRDGTTIVKSKKAEVTEKRKLPVPEDT